MNAIDSFALGEFDTQLEEQGRPVESFEIEPKYLKLLYLKDIHGLADAGIVAYIDGTLRDALALQPNLNPSTVWRKEQALTDDAAGRVAIKKAATVAVFEACLELDSVPEYVLAEHDIPTEDSLKTVPRTREQEAMRNWARWFLEYLTDPLTFHRAGEDDPDEDVEGHEYARYIGLSAHLAVQQIAPNSGIDTADYCYPRQNIPTGDAMLGNIRALDDETDEDDERFVDDGPPKPDEWPPEVQQQFEDCYDRFFDEADALGLLDGTKTLAVDVTKIGTTTDKETTEAVTGGSGSGREPDTYGKHAWSYQFLAILNGESPFVRSVAPIYNESEMPDRLDEQLQMTTSGTTVDINLIVCDKGYYSKNAIEACRKYLGEACVICAEIGGEIEELLEDASEGEIIIDPSVNIGQPPLKPRPSAFAYPNTNASDGEQEETPLGRFDAVDSNNDEQRTPLTSDDDQPRSHIVYITYMDLTEANMRKIHRLYLQRNAIESIIGQMRDTHAPQTESIDPAVRAYMMNMAGLFYNTHHLINRTLSPELGIPLNPTGKEVLTAIRDVAFR